MSYYENNFAEQNIDDYNNDYNNLEEGYNNGDSFYYLTENEQVIGGLDDNIYQEDNYENNYEHMEDQRQAQIKQEVDPVAPRVFAPVAPRVAPQRVATAKNIVKAKKVKKAKTEMKLNWLYVLLVIVIISLIAYYLIDQKIIKMPSFGSSGSTSSPSSSSFRTTLGSTFMSLH
jgi:hypothetical protein